MPRRILPFTAAALFFLSAVSTVTTTARTAAQDKLPDRLPSPALVADSNTVKPSQTFIQIDGASLIASFSALGVAVAAGIRSAAGVVTRYMAAQEGKGEARELAQATAVKTLAEVVARYHADRAAVPEALEEFAEDLEEMREAFAEAAGRPKPHKRPRKRPPPLPHLPTVSDNTDAPAKPVSNI